MTFSFCRQLRISCGLLLAFCFSQASATAAVTSRCFGTPAHGRLENGVELPRSGANFVSYSHLAAMLGRTYVHSTVRDIMLDAYAALEKDQPGKVYQYAETGSREGGPFKPHKTHQNGLSVDFMVPVLNAEGESVHLPTHVFNRFGYDIEFDKAGHYKDYVIDYEAMAAHIVELRKSALKHGADLTRVIFDPDMQAPLFETRDGPYLKAHLNFSKKPAWVRHDEHYHVDFKLVCSP
ncbi:MAG TPA: penicillin-insensitive murein endopeptidase [Gammaproteobacteria bacterium]|nr:penicillin-insensitive murein endopeptidase [Gammaproteobacteria bacterium]